MSIDINSIRKQFPILDQEVYKKPLVYLDNGATSQNPISVIDSIKDYYLEYNSNVHRGTHYLSQVATKKLEDARETLREFVNAKSTKEIIFTKGTTDSINLVASVVSESLLNEGDEVIISTLEHHSNIVPWQLACEKKKAKLKVIPINQEGEILLDEYEKLLTNRTKIVATSHVSNALGTINPIKKIIDLAHKVGAKVLIDGAQSVPHIKVDVQELDCDFYCFSGHKMYGPTGIGVLYGKEEILKELPPYQGGGEMIAQVTFEKTTYNELPYKYEAGTPNIEGGIALAAAVDFMNSIGIDNIKKHEEELLEYATEKLLEIGDITIIGTAKEKAGVLSFLINGVHPFDVGTLLDKLGVAVRTGHHCTQPLMNFYNIAGTIRASFAVYNTKEEIDIFIEALKKVKGLLM